jgi:hypothetical protein
MGYIGIGRRWVAHKGKRSPLFPKKDLDGNTSYN